MGVTYCNTNPIGTGGQVPLIIYINTTDTDDVVGQPNYLVPLISQGYNFFNGQMALVNTADGASFWDVVVTRVGRSVIYTLVLNTDGSVTSVTATVPVLSSGGMTPNISLQNQGIGTGSATNANVSYNEYGIITGISSGSADLLPFEVLTLDATISVNHGYFTNSNLQLTLTAPASFTLSDEIEVANINTGGFVIQLNAGQIIQFGNQSTSSGGTLVSSTIGDALRLVAYSSTNLIVLSSVARDLVFT